MAQRGISDAESTGWDEVRAPRRRNSPSDPSSRESEDHVLTRLVSKSEVEPRDTKGKAAKSLRMARRSQSCRVIIVSLEPEIESVKRKCNSVETVQSW